MTALNSNVSTKPQQTLLFKPSLLALIAYVQALEKHNWVYAFNDDTRIYNRGKKAQLALEAQAMAHYLYQKAFDIWYQYISFSAATAVDRTARRDAAITSLYAEQMVFI